MGELLRKEVEELRRIKRELQEKVNQVEDFEGDINKFNKWLEKAHTIGIDVKTNWLDDESAEPTEVGKLDSHICWSKNFEEISEIMNSVSVLVAEGKKLLQSFFIKGSELVWRGGFVQFQSRKPAYDKIMESLKDENIDIIGILGLGGIGKTKLMEEIGKHVEDAQLFDKVLMAPVSQNLDIIYTQGALADALGLKFQEETETGRATELRARLLKERKLLVILDDVWEKINLDCIGVTSYSNHKGWKIVITSRREKVCEVMCCNIVVRLGVLNEAEARHLFSSYAKLYGRISKKLQACMQKIVRECGGLPLAIVIVGSALRGKELEDYEDALERLSSSNFVDVESADKEIYSCLKLSYDYLKDEDAKKCLLLCSVHPEDHVIKLKDLTRYAYGQWMFENVQSFDEARKRIFTSVETLEDACLLLNTPPRRRPSYFQAWPSVKMHDMVRDFAIWIAKGNATPFFVLTPSRKLQRRIYENATAFYVTKFSLDGQFPNETECPNLKILIIKSDISTEDIPVNLLRVASVLQVLDVDTYRTTSVMLPPILLDNLYNLRSLHLRGILSIRSNDVSMMGTLKNLEILELSLGTVKTIPEWIGGLCNLRLLDLSTWHILEVIPQHLLSKLAKLEELYTPIYHRSGKWSADYLSDVKFLPQLTAFAGTFLGFQSLPEDIAFGNLQMYFINCRRYRLKDEGIRYARSLGLDVWNDLSMKVFEKLFPNVECLQIVGADYIHGIQNMCPQIDNTGFQHLRELFLEGIYSLNCLIDATTSGLKLSFPTMVFPFLVVLTLDNMCQLRKMCYGPLPISCLGELTKAIIVKCPKLENIVPDMLPFESKLQVLNIMECYQLKYVYEMNKKQLQRPLPCPGFIELSDLFVLQSIWNVPQQLESIDKEEVEWCKQINRCLESLVNMKVHNCFVLEGIFPLVEYNQKSEAVLSKLAGLELVFLPKLKCIWNGHHQSFCLRNLEHIEIEECGALKSVFTFTLAQSLQKLQYLAIKNCEALEAIIVQDDHAEAMRGSCSFTLQNGLQELKKIKIESCDKLNTVLPMAFVAQGLPKLESIFIENCKELNHVFGSDGETIQGESDPVVEFNKNLDAQLSNLVELQLTSLPKLNFIWNGTLQNGSLENLECIELKNCGMLTSVFTSTLAQSLRKIRHLVISECESLETIIMQDDQDEGKSFQKIEEITIMRCSNLKVVLPSSFVVHGLPKLQRIYIEDCAKLENIFGLLGDDLPVDNKKFNAQLSNLVELHLTSLPNLKCIWNGSQQNCSLQNLELIRLKDCDSLTSLFACAHTKSLQKLVHLEIDTCKALETIIAHNDEDEEMRGSYSFMSQDSFQEIKEIFVKSCKNLKTALPVSFVAQGLPKLERIYVRDCAKMQQIFGDHENKNVAQGGQVIMDNLKELGLVNLPSLVRFAPLEYSIIVSSSSLKPKGEDNGVRDLLNLLPQSQHKPHSWIWRA